MNARMTTRTKRPNPKFDSIAFQMFKHPTFVQAVNRAANLKVLEAIKAGRLRVAQPNNLRGPLRYSPRMDLIDDPLSSKVIALFELPGIKSSDISLEIQNGQLVVFGKRNPPPLSALRPDTATPLNPASSQDTYMETDDRVGEAQSQHRHVELPVQELRYGTFHRAIPVSDGMKESDVSATLHEGMLTVTWPKSPVARTASPSRSSNGSSPPASVLTAGTALQ